MASKKKGSSKKKAATKKVEAVVPEVAESKAQHLRSANTLCKMEAALGKMIARFGRYPDDEPGLNAKEAAGNLETARDYLASAAEFLEKIPNDYRPKGVGTRRSKIIEGSLVTIKANKLETYEETLPTEALESGFKVQAVIGNMVECKIDKRIYCLPKAHLRLVG